MCRNQSDLKETSFEEVRESLSQTEDTSNWVADDSSFAIFTAFKLTVELRYFSQTTAWLQIRWFLRTIHRLESLKFERTPERRWGEKFFVLIWLRVPPRGGSFRRRFNLNFSNAPLFSLHHLLPSPPCSSWSTKLQVCPRSLTIFHEVLTNPIFADISLAAFGRKEIEIAEVLSMDRSASLTQLTRALSSLVVG
jgi:hypothetical protein